MNNILEYGYRSVGIEISGSCNFKCKFCPSHNSKKTHAQMRKEDVFVIINQIKNCNGKELDYITLNILGEPLCHSDLIEIVKYIKHKGIKIKIITNGFLLTDKIFNQLLDLNVDYIKLSVVSFNRIYFNELRGTKRTYDEYIKTLITIIDRIYKHGRECKTELQMELLYIYGYYFKNIFGIIGNKKISLYDLPQ